MKARATKFTGWMGTIVNSIVCKVHDLRSISSRSNEVKIAKCSGFAWLGLSLLWIAVVVFKCSKIGINDVLDITNDAIQMSDPPFDLRSPI